MSDGADIAVVGAGAAGLMAAIQAARAEPALNVVALDSQARLGAKILISGGGRCNVTHHEVTSEAFNGSTRPAIRKVLRGFDVPEVVTFFEEQAVHLKREETGKLFPTTNRARTVLDALLAAAESAGVVLRHPFRVESVEQEDGGFVLAGPQGVVHARRVILASGGKSVVQTGSDGHGFQMARSLGHSVTPLYPALVPLCLPDAHPLTTLRGVSVPAQLEVRRVSGKRLAHVAGPVLFTHFGLSGPATLDVSRHWLITHAEDPDVQLVASWFIGTSREELDSLLRNARGRIGDAFEGRLPRRVVDVLLSLAGVERDGEAASLTRDARKALVRTMLEQPLPVTGHRGWRFAEVTAGGVPLKELVLPTLESRRVPGLYLCGEICDVDGRIGGFNFQWAWASGTLAGRAAAASGR